MYACILADIFQTCATPPVPCSFRAGADPTELIPRSFAGVEHCIVLGDVAYGACCVDDLSATALGADFLVHYGHNCLVPVDVTTMPCMYVFVDIKFDTAHMVACVRENFQPGAHLAVAGTIQFASAVYAAKALLAAEFPSLVVPQVSFESNHVLRLAVQSDRPACAG